MRRSTWSPEEAQHLAAKSLRMPGLFRAFMRRKREDGVVQKRRPFYCNLIRILSVTLSRIINIIKKKLVVLLF